MSNAPTCNELGVLDKRWRAACRVIFKEEIGPLSDYLEWLEGLIAPNEMHKSSISNKDVAYAISQYAKGSKWVSLDEIDFGTKQKPLSINEIKDFDSLVASASEYAAYAGNIVLGNSGNIEKSSSISDSFFMYNCSLLGDCKYCANCSTGRLCVDSFGTYGPGESELCIRCSQTYRDRRCFELWMGQNCSDCYYSFNIGNCAECIFCFNVKNRRNCIGNLELPKEKYFALKEKLLAEMAEELKAKKKLPSLMEIAARMPFEKPIVAQVQPEDEEFSGKRAAETAFGKTTGMLLGKEFKGIDSYKKWLERHTYPVEAKKSVASGRTTWTAAHTFTVVEVPEKRIVAMDEALEIGKLRISESDAEELRLSNAHELLKKLAFFSVEFRTGTNIGISECATAIDSALSYRTSDMVYSKYCGYTFYPRSSEHAFGCNQIFDSSFCINCYYSVKLSRCFEMDSCRSCSDSYFCHNCENLQDCMFCFNAKNLRYAVGNVEVGREKYLKIRQMLQNHIVGKLDAKKDFEFDIYNIGAGN